MYNFINDLLSSMGVLVCAFYMFYESLKLQISFLKKASSVLWCLLIAILYAFNPLWIPATLTRPVHCLISIIFIMFLNLKVSAITVISVFLISFCFSYVTYYLSRILVTIASTPFGSIGYEPGTIIDYNIPIFLLIVGLTLILQLVFFYFLIHSRRFQRVLLFMREKNNMLPIALLASGSVMFFAALINSITVTNDITTLPILHASLIIIGVGIFIWIRRAVKKMLLHRVRERNEEILAKENEKLKRQIEQLNANQEVLQAASHNILHRLQSMERHYQKMLGRFEGYAGLSEFSDELSFELDRVLQLRQEYQEDIKGEQVDFCLPSTNIKAIDELFAYFAARFEKENVEFKLKLTGSVVHMCETVIPQNRLETLIGDHLEDAYIAIKANDTRARRCIFALLGEAGGNYEFAVHDTGIPFAVDTLIRLGAARVTTHADAGGSGAGFMKTFETMRACAASLIITENQPDTAFTKSVAVRFDQRDEYTIKSYRAEDIPASERYKVVSL